MIDLWGVETPINVLGRNSMLDLDTFLNHEIDFSERLCDGLVSEKRDKVGLVYERRYLLQHT